MRKIRLDVDALRVESFDTGAGWPARGTVHGRHHTWEAGCGEPPPEDSIFVCPAPTAALTCANTCGTCDVTCGSTCGCGGTYGAVTCNAYQCTEPDPGTVDINVC